MIGKEKRRSPRDDDTDHPPQRKSGGFSSGGIVFVAALGVVVWQVTGPDGSRPSQLFGQALYEAWYEPGLRAEVREAEIDRCSQVVTHLLERQTANTERLTETAKLSLLGSVGMSVIYDVMGDHAAAMFPRKTALNELNAAEQLSLLQEYLRLRDTGAIIARGTC